MTYDNLWAQNKKLIKLKGEKLMNRTQIMDTIGALANSQGFYRRIYDYLLSLDEDDLNAVLDDLEAKDFADAVDMVLYFET